VACLRCQLEIVHLLIKGGADPKIHNLLDQGPLYYTFTRMKETENVYENRMLCFKMAEILLNNGEDIDQIVNK